ncbi:hypothetical protein RRU01S_14_00660 [Agrobacterium rubi TR3 = NBRC 13261]|uniref:Uncharacterized protein n=1 Tax=Agrobacterium rubi TR3 = NBRC 13261 TaxID=1368415 RepID=A0A081CVZ9_9HYPH|nr:hypothetical protein RRU01S_14_00660 [Agrobacterium rubi TR3 = NBRC 13261]
MKLGQVPGRASCAADLLIYDASQINKPRLPDEPEMNKGAGLKKRIVRCNVIETLQRLTGI